MSDKRYLEIAQNYLSKGRILDCIAVLKDSVKDESIRTQILQLEIRLNSLRRRVTEGTIDINDAQLEENRISNAVLMLITNLAKEEPKFTSPAATKNHSPAKSFDYKTVLIGVLVLALLGLGYYVINSSGNTSTDPCDKIECLNRGTCLNGKCDCPSGYTGRRCETKIEVADPCKGIKCLNNGVCRDGTCDCPSGYTGKRCETKVEVADPCKGIICLNNGVCRDGTCNCPSGYTGRRCETKIAAADPNTLVDSRDNNKYKIKKIGNTYWTLENMRYKISGSKCKDCNTKGRHYNLAMAKKACPSGWSLPSASDFKALMIRGGSFDRTARLASIEFNGRYGRSSGGNSFVSVGTFAAYWTSSSQGGNGSHYFFNKSVKLARADVQGDDQMYSCRCVKK